MFLVLQIDLILYIFYIRLNKEDLPVCKILQFTINWILSHGLENTTFSAQRYCRYYYQYSICFYYTARVIAIIGRSRWGRNGVEIFPEFHVKCVCSLKADNGTRITNETGHVYQLYSTRRAYAVSFQLALQAELIARYKSPRLKKFE